MRNGAKAPKGVYMRDLLYNILYDSSVAVAPFDMIKNLSVAALLAIVIYITYRLTFSGVVYSKKFNITLVMLCIISTMVMTIIGSSIALSLGMVGALSIVRFRTAVKDPRDTAYIFWAISVGLGTGSGNYMIAIIGTAAVALLTIIFSIGIQMDNKYLVIVRGDIEKMEDIRAALFKNYRQGKLRAETITPDYAEIVYQIKMKRSSKSADYESIRNIEGVLYINIVAQNGETLG
jgi:uncharacterized membrane protein YhiD involved in acid resistance